MHRSAFFFGGVPAADAGNGERKVRFGLRFRAGIAARRGQIRTPWSEPVARRLSNGQAANGPATA
jgi:hypothetical protein